VQRTYLSRIMVVEYNLNDLVMTKDIWMGVDAIHRGIGGKVSRGKRRV